MKAVMPVIPKVPELYLCRDNGYEPQLPATDGWLVSRATGIEFRATAQRKLECRVSDHPATTALLPQ